MSYPASNGVTTRLLGTWLAASHQTPKNRATPTTVYNALMSFCRSAPRLPGCLRASMLGRSGEGSDGRAMGGNFIALPRAPADRRRDSRTRRRIALLFRVALDL